MESETRSRPVASNKENRSVSWNSTGRHEISAMEVAIASDYGISVLGNKISFAPTGCIIARELMEELTLFHSLARLFARSLADAPSFSFSLSLSTR